MDKIDKSKLGLLSEGTLTWEPSRTPRRTSTSMSPANSPATTTSSCAPLPDKLGLKVEFKATGFASLLSQVQNKQFDLGSSSISTTDARRETVGFTNGYDFGYMAVVAKTDGDVKGFKDLTKDTRIAVVQGTVQDDYVTNTLQIEPVRFEDYNTAYANVKNGQVDAWVAPSQQATGQVKEGDGTVIAESVVNTQNFTAYAVNKDNQPLIDALNSGLDAVIADGTWSKLTKEWYPDRETPATWSPGSKAVTVPELS